jgi:hypothetical protein
MESEEQAAVFFARYGLADIPRFSDPEQKLYGAFGLKRGTLNQLLGPKVWLRGAGAFVHGHGFARPQTDPLQMPGAFLVYHGRILKGGPHKTSADRPDYLALARCDGPGCRPADNPEESPSAADARNTE